MNKYILMKITTLTVFVILLSTNLNAKETNGINGKRAALLKTTASGCNNATAAIDLDINNVRARLMTGGDMWWNMGLGEAAYEIPKGSKKNSLFAGSCWIGGIDANGQLKVAAQTYRQTGNDYWPGPLDNNAAITQDVCSNWDKFWKVDRSTILSFLSEIQAINATGTAPNYDAIINNSKYDVIRQWPARGNRDAKGVSSNLDVYNDMAPYANVDSDPDYSWRKGDYPMPLTDPQYNKANPSQFIWWVFNDAGNIKGESQTGAIGMEVQTTAFAYSTKDNMNDASFVNYRVINRGTLRLDSTYIATWTDADLGDANDDFIGCDTVRGLGILYNGKNFDGHGQPNSYGSHVPMVGVDFFIGPTKRYKINGKDTAYKLPMQVFNWFNNPPFGARGPNDDPQNGIEIYNYMTGTNRIGAPMHNDADPVNGCTGHGLGPITRFVFWGNPLEPGSFSECQCSNKPGDRRFVHSAGPFKLESGGVANDITIGVVWAAETGGCPTTTFNKLQAIDDQAQGLFDSHFAAVTPPDAPDMTIRELDRKLIFTLSNPKNSNNYLEKYGRGNKLDSAENSIFNVGKTPKSIKYADSLYKFEGYRVFQLKNSEVGASQIFGSNGEIDHSVAYEVFHCDIRNNLNELEKGKIYNYTNTDGKWYPSLKISSIDSGISHTFQIDQDQFSITDDKRLVNYHNYYFVAIAYSYNDFHHFSTDSQFQVNIMQEMPYLESSTRAGAKALEPVVGLPNPSNGNMGTTLNANYGDGVIIKRIEGIGNDKIALQMDQSSEDLALAEKQAKFPTYLAGAGPVNVKVIDPVKLKSADWELFIYGGLNADSSKGLKSDSSMHWKLVNLTNNDVIMNERNIDVLNEQILANYGLSVAVVQPTNLINKNENTYIGSSVSFQDPNKLWLTGMIDQDGFSPLNWIRSGMQWDSSNRASVCRYEDIPLDTFKIYDKMLSNNTALISTWAPYALAANDILSNIKTYCPSFGVAVAGTSTVLTNLHSVDVVFTSDKSKWTKCPVVEMSEDVTLSEHNVRKYGLRGHRSWNLDINSSGNPIYASDPTDTGMSYFPGYAIDQETGERLDIVFGEDSWLKSDNGADMIWNPSSTLIDNSGNWVRGGKHYVYILDSKYGDNSANSFLTKIKTGTSSGIVNAFKHCRWVGTPIVNPGFTLLPLKDNLIPTETRLKFRVERPYNRYIPDASVPLRNNGFPLYSFSTKAMVTDGVADNNKNSLLDQIYVVPNPYYAYSGFETNRLDSKVEIINLPRQATVNIYSLDGTLIRTLNKDNDNAYLEWDVKNSKSLPIASGMYLIHVKAVGIGETVIKWFGAMRPIDATTN